MKKIIFALMMFCLCWITSLQAQEKQKGELRRTDAAEPKVAGADDHAKVPVRTFEVHTFRLENPMDESSWLILKPRLQKLIDVTRVQADLSAGIITVEVIVKDKPVAPRATEKEIQNVIMDNGFKVSGKRMSVVSK